MTDLTLDVKVALYHSRRFVNGETVVLDTPVASLVYALADACAEKGLTLSRWQSNGANFYTYITWAAHYGERSHQTRYLPEGAIVAQCTLSQQEGQTTRCEAHRELGRLLEDILHV